MNRACASFQVAIFWQLKLVSTVPDFSDSTPLDSLKFLFWYHRCSGCEVAVVDVNDLKKVQILAVRLLSVYQFYELARMNFFIAPISMSLP